MPTYITYDLGQGHLGMPVRKELLLVLAKGKGQILFLSIISWSWLGDSSRSWQSLWPLYNL